MSGCHADLVEELRRRVGIGQQDGLHPGPSHSHVEHPPLRIEVVAQAVREQPLVHPEDDDAIPLPALDPVDRGQQHAWLRGVPRLEDRAEPGLERRRLWVEAGHSLQRDQVVGVGRSIDFVAGGVEDIDRIAQPDVEPDRPQARHLDEWCRPE